MSNFIDNFKLKKFENLIEKENKIINKIENIIKNKDHIFNNINNKINNNNINYNNLLNRLYLINNLIESLEVELENLDNDNEKLFNNELDSNVKKIIRDEKYTKNTLKPFLPYILLYSIYNIDEY